MKKNHMAASDKRGRWPFALDLLSIFFILSAPYLVFIDNTDFLFEAANLYIVVSFAVIAAILSVLLRIVPSAFFRVAILTIPILLFMDIQLDWTQWRVKYIAVTTAALFLVLWILRAHVSQILCVGFGMIVAVTLVTSLYRVSLQNDSTTAPGADSGKTHLPVYVHIILDEQMGIEGFDTDIASHNTIRREIEAFFAENQFRTFSRAYSPYYDSNDSISSVLNPDTAENIKHLYSSKEFNYILLKNAYLENLANMGYDINVYQSTYMDLCSSIRKKIQTCLTYNYYGISSAALAGLSDYEKTIIVLAIYSDLSVLIKTATKFYKILHRRLGGIGGILPSWSGRVGPIPTLPVFDKLIEDVAASAGGEMFLAHLLIPHYPYSVDQACNIRRPVISWSNRYIGTYDPDNVNTPRSRLAHYEKYILQVRCALLKLEELLDALKSQGTFENSIVIVHGDHGSRIVLVAPRIENINRLSHRDFYDAFSTLYAVKSPGSAPGYDTRMLSLPKLIQNTVSGDISKSAEPTPNTRPTVFLRDHGKTRFQEVPMPYLPNGNR